ncbi:MAG: hypothetical protein HY901_12470 [Deltaproteobacteria bacterium]|nr:hypothetical protein [Deltaproteobacteria bacterium]
MDHRLISEGMPVHSADGQNLGRVIKCNPDKFLIEKGPFFPQEYEADYEEVVLVRNGEATLAESGDSLRETMH